MSPIVTRALTSSPVAAEKVTNKRFYSQVVGGGGINGVVVVMDDLKGSLATKGQRGEL